MKHKRLVVIVAMACLTGCAGMGQSQQRSNWEQYRSEVMAQRSAGALTPMQAQLDLWTKYRELFGEDPAANGFYAYSVNLMSSVEKGALSLEEAQALIDAREREVSARRVAELERNRSYDAYGNPP